MLNNVKHLPFPALGLRKVEILRFTQNDTRCVSVP